jgi:hypothetical protein
MASLSGMPTHESVDQRFKTSLRKVMHELTWAEILTRRKARLKYHFCCVMNKHAKLNMNMKTKPEQNGPCNIRTFPK